VIKFIFPGLLLIISFAAIGQSENPIDSTRISGDSSEYKIFEKVETEASFPGGDQAWRKFLEKNLNANTPVDNDAPIGIYTVIVQFIVDKEGNIGEMKPLTNYGYGLEKEVLRVLKLQTKWSPAFQNGRPVKAYRKQPVTFVVEFDGIDIQSKENFVLYTGVDNSVSVHVNKVKDNDLQLTITQGTITANGDGNYTVRVNNPGRAIIEIFKKKKSLASAYFTVKSPTKSSAN